MSHGTPVDSRDERVPWSVVAAGFSVVVPLFNEEERFAEYGKALVEFVADQPAGSEVIFVDDGSTDGTVARGRGSDRRDPGQPIRLIRRPHAGKGAAVAAGLRAATAPYAGFCDLDLSTPLDQLERDPARRDAVARARGRLARPRRRRRCCAPESRVREALGRTYNRLLQATITPGIVDTQCGAKVAAREVWDAILPHCREVGYAWDAEAIAVARSLRIPVQRGADRVAPRRPLEGARRSATASRWCWATQRIWRNVRERGGRELGDAGRAARCSTTPTPSCSWTPTRTTGGSAARRRSSSTALRRTNAGAPRDGWLVDVGAGSGGVTALIGWDPERMLVVEGNEALVRQADARARARRRAGRHRPPPARRRRRPTSCACST